MLYQAILKALHRSPCLHHYLLLQKPLYFKFNTYKITLIVAPCSLTGLSVIIKIIIIKATLLLNRGNKTFGVLAFHQAD